MKGVLAAILYGSVMMISIGGVSADEKADRIIAATRYSATLQQQDLHGTMTKNGKKTAISLFLRKENIQFLYKLGGEDKRFHMRLEEDRFDLLEIVGGKTRRFDDKQLAQKINDTDLSYEDLSMRFLYWKGAKVMGEEKVSGQLCYKVRLENPSKTAGDYRIVYVWAHKKYGALMKVMGYDAKGRPLKQFKVTDLMKVGKEYTLEQMRVDTINPENNKVTGMTYLKFKKPKRSSSRSR